MLKRHHGVWALLLGWGLGGLLACQAVSPSSGLLPTPSSPPATPMAGETTTAGPETAVTLPFAALPSATPSLTATPLPPTDTPEPTFTPSPTYPPGWRPSPTRWRYVTRTPTITPTPTPPPPAMRINRPGPYSKLVSPIQVEALISPGEDGYVYVDLIGEDGRYLVRQALDFRAYRDRRFYIAPEIPFEIATPAEVARLVIYTLDRFGRTIYLCSSEVVLQQLGRNVLEPVRVDVEPFLVRSPREGETVRGGVLVVRGVVRPLTGKPVLIELIAPDGQVVGSAEVTPGMPYGDLSHVPFEAYVPYTVSGPTEVRLTLRQESDTRIPGTVALNSWLITVAP
ncbi:hypothetical protein SE15_06925 [Thermanaerothrix daxensis]|uniref:Bacterial spore germination immunoglobulin-like domain-containing protein n=1 Tax=Thermanaerothrix daxensis TaxID=869279 RepID=A0A0P6XJY5_9CHLR|nr:hypothetical protein [Thermanaerothrix daxensis]KPL83406.1 hypothetical protein SE15_06925 [Thermanaerothrix daxensis]